MSGIGHEVVPTSYGYGQDARVVTQRQLEQMLANGDEVPSPVVMIQCVESREPERPYCSRICCTKAITNALAIKERDPDAAVTVLYREVRAYGFREDAYREARDRGVAFLRYDLDHKPEVKFDDGAVRVSITELLMQQEIDLLSGQMADLLSLHCPSQIERGLWARATENLPRQRSFQVHRLSPRGHGASTGRITTDVRPVWYQLVISLFSQSPAFRPVRPVRSSCSSGL